MPARVSRCARSDGSRCSAVAIAPSTDTRTTPLAAHRPAPLERPAPPPWRALPVILLGTLIALSSYFMVNLALESIARDLHASNSMLSLITAGYSLSYAATLVAGGRL